MRLILFMMAVWMSRFLQAAEPPPSSAPPWAPYRVVDIHAHIGHFRGFNLETGNLLESMERYGVRLALISNIDGAEMPGRTDNLSEALANVITADTVREHPDRLRGLIWTRPGQGSADGVEPFLQNEKLKDGATPVFVGMKFHPEMNHFAADDPLVDPYLRLCEKYGLPAVFHCGADGSDSAPAKIHAAARRHPKVPIVLYHMGFGTSHASAIAAAKEAWKKSDARLYLETAQTDPESVLKAIREVGSNRVLFGTDATYFGRDHYQKYESLVSALKKELPEKDFEKVMHANAEKLFKLP